MEMLALLIPVGLIVVMCWAVCWAVWDTAHSNADGLIRELDQHLREARATAEKDLAEAKASMAEIRRNMERLRAGQAGDADDIVLGDDQWRNDSRSIQRSDDLRSKDPREVG